MRKFILLVSLISIYTGIQAQEWNSVEASELTIIGKLMPTSNPYHRVDTTLYKGFNSDESLQVRCASGMAVVFSTDSDCIWVDNVYGEQYHFLNSMTPYSYRGYDLYIKKDGEWLWAGANCPPIGKDSVPLPMASNMSEGEKECLLYFPLFTEILSCRIRVPAQYHIKAIPNPFRHRVAVHGSSFTHGISTSRAGMSYPSQFSRMTGIQLLPLGCSGNCKMQDYFANVLADVEADAFILDAFANPRPEEMRERFFPFLEKLIAAHPGKPIIFQRCIYMEERNFNQVQARFEEEKAAVADSLMAIACKRYKDVYYITPDTKDKRHDSTTVDGIHPGDYGYTLWAESIRKPILKILKKYGIR